MQNAGVAEVSWMGKQHGQTIVEFAIIFPIFLFLAVAVIYFCLAMADYMTLHQAARDSARLLSMSESPIDSADLRRSCAKQYGQSFFFYGINADSSDALQVTEGEDSDIRNVSGSSVEMLTVSITAQRKSEVKGFAVLDMSFELPDELKVQYSVHKE